MLADVFHWRQIHSAARREIKSHKANNASAPLSGKEGDDSVSLARSGERSEKSLPYKHFVQGRYRTTAPAVERVCSKAVAVCSSGVGADTVGAQRVRYRGNVEASHCDTFLFRCTDRAAQPLF